MISKEDMQRLYDKLGVEQLHVTVDGVVMDPFVEPQTEEEKTRYQALEYYVQQMLLDKPFVKE
jgi:hypothetical protein